MTPARVARFTPLLALHPKMPTTCGWDNYTKVTLGTLKFTSAGVATIKLSADEAGWSPVNMRKIVLRP